MMDSKTICELLAKGASFKIKSMPFNVNELRKMAKAALMGDAMLEIAVGKELTATDIAIIGGEAPNHVCFDLHKTV